MHRNELTGFSWRWVVGVVTAISSKGVPRLRVTLLLRGRIRIQAQLYLPQRRSWHARGERERSKHGRVVACKEVLLRG